jgi:hypothetical protein
LLGFVLNVLDAPQNGRQENALQVAVVI